MSAQRKPYHGSTKRLVIGMDVGTTFSGVSYAFLQPGEVPQIQGVHRFPAQESVGGDCKIPTVLYYDDTGVVMAAGAEALQGHVVEEAEERKWRKCEWFKLNLRPKRMVVGGEWVDIPSEEDVPPLPRGKSAVAVFADFLHYLLECTRTYIEDTHANGQAIWKSVEGHIDYILSHPNGWEGVQQSQMRKAAVMAGLVPNTQTGYGRVRFVTEGEASLNFCIGNGLASDLIKSGQGVIIVDAGGGTVDLSAYAQVSGSSSFEEIAPTECLFQGSIYVTKRAHTLLKGKLQKSRFGAEEALKGIVDCFDKTAKLRFRNQDDTQYVRFGSVLDKDIEVNIKGGQLKIEGRDVADLFQPSIEAVIDGIERQRRNSDKPISVVLLVGGFSTSDWLFAKLKEHLQSHGIVFCRPDAHMNKAVADGAISFFVDNHVSARVSRFTYGTPCIFTYTPSDPEHVSREISSYKGPSGKVGTRVSESKEFKHGYFREKPSAITGRTITANILSYRGTFDDPKWMDTESEMFTTICTIKGDTTGQKLVKRFNEQGEPYWVQDYDIILNFGLTELTAELAWVEKGVEKRSPATVVYDHVDGRARD